MQKESEYEWAKRLSKSLFSDVQSWQDDKDPVYEKDDVWAVKKLLAIDWYIGRFTELQARILDALHMLTSFVEAG
jgi:hypothetical protein